jgi:hypothetical protein
VIFLAPSVAYIFAAFLNNRIHMRFGQRGVATIAPLCRIVSYIITCIHPPYPVLPIIFMLGGFANGLEGVCLCKSLVVIRSLYCEIAKVFEPLFKFRC